MALGLVKALEQFSSVGHARGVSCRLAAQRVDSVLVALEISSIGSPAVTMKGPKSWMAL